MSTKANTTVGASRLCYKAVKPVVCLACIVVCLVGLVPATSAIAYPFANTSYNLVTVVARPFQADTVTFSNPIVAELSPDTPAQYPFTQQILYIFEGTDEDYYFDMSNPIVFTGAFCLDDIYCLSMLLAYEGGAFDCTYHGYFVKLNQGGYLDEIDFADGVSTGILQLSNGGFADLDAQNFGFSPPSDDIYYFLGTVELWAETFGNVTIGLRNMIAEGNNINSLFHTFESLNIVDLGTKRIAENGTYQLSYIQDGAVYVHPSVAVQVIGSEEHSHYWLLRSIEPVFNTPIFGENFTIGTLILILMAVALLSLVLKLCFGG